MKESGRKTNNFYGRTNWFAILPLAAVLCAFALPYGAALFGALDGGVDPSEGSAFFKNITHLPVLPIAAFTIQQAFWSALLSLALGLPGAWAVGTSDSRFARILRSVSSLPFAMPSILAALGFVLFFGNAGWLNRLIAALTGSDEHTLRILYQPAAIVLAHAFFNFPLVVRLGGDALERARLAYAPAAAVLGASPWTAARTVFFPIIAPGVLRAALLAFLYSFTSFSIVLVLGGGPRATTLAVEIYRYSRIALSFHEAGVFAAAETIIAALVFGLSLFFERKTRVSAQDNIRRAMEKSHPSLSGAVFLCLYLIVIGFIALGPLLSIVAESFLSRATRSGAAFFSLRWWAAIGERCIPALLRSLFLAVVSACAACVLALISAWIVKNSEKSASSWACDCSTLPRLIRLAVSLPLCSSGIVLGLGFLILYGQNHGRGASLAAVVALHAVSALPFAANALLEGFHTANTGILNAAESLGAGPFRRLFTVDIPLCSRHIRSAFGFSMAISLGELNAVMMLGLENFETLPLLIYRAAGAYRYGTACAAGVLLMGCCAAAFALSDTGVS